PVHIDLPYDVMLSQALDGQPDRLQSMAVAEAEEIPALEAIAAAIDGATRPAIIAGLQVTRSGVAAEIALRALAERLGAPVFASMSAKGVLPENHSLAAGIFRGVETERALLGEADLILMLGFDPVEIFTPGTWRYGVPVITI